jgi:hypothetical protein
MAADPAQNAPPDEPEGTGNPVPRVLWRTPHATARKSGDRPAVPGKLVARGPMIKVAESDTKPADSDKLVPGSVIRRSDTGPAADPEETDQKAQPEEPTQEAHPDEGGQEPELEASDRETGPDAVAQTVQPAEPGEEAESGEPGQAGELEEPGQEAAPAEPIQEAELEEPGQEAEPGETGQEAAPEARAQVAEPQEPDEAAEPEVAALDATSEEPASSAEIELKRESAVMERGRHAAAPRYEPAATTSALEPATTAADSHDVKWREIKAGFVDDPPTSVELSFAMVEWAVKELVDLVRTRHVAQETSAIDGAPDTEHLRQALLGYKGMYDELRDVSSRLAGPSGPRDGR